ncbi:MAG: hypothetical protein NVS3B12_06410 [Acidimicrobiales bacterium]
MSLIILKMVEVEQQQTPPVGGGDEVRRRVPLGAKGFTGEGSEWPGPAGSAGDVYTARVRPERAMGIGVQDRYGAPSDC